MQNAKYEEIKKAIMAANPDPKSIFDFVMPDDVKQIAPHVLGHRLILRPESRLRKKTVAGIVAEILNTIPVPQVHPDGPAR